MSLLGHSSKITAWNLLFIATSASALWASDLHRSASEDTLGSSSSALTVSIPSATNATATVQSRDGNSLAEPAPKRRKLRDVEALPPLGDLSALPREILHHVMDFLPVKDDVRLTWICKAFANERATRNHFYRIKLESRLDQDQKRQYIHLVNWSLPLMWQSDEMFWRITRQSREITKQPFIQESPLIYYQKPMIEYLAALGFENGLKAKIFGMIEGVYGYFDYDEAYGAENKDFNIQYDEGERLLEQYIKRGAAWAVDVKIRLCRKGYDSNYILFARHNPANFPEISVFLKSQAENNHPKEAFALFKALEPYEETDLDFCEESYEWVYTTLKLLNNKKSYYYCAEIMSINGPEYFLEHKRRLLADAVDLGHAWARKYYYELHELLDTPEEKQRAEECLFKDLEAGKEWAKEKYYYRLESSDLEEDQRRAKTMLFEGARKGENFFVAESLKLCMRQQALSEEICTLLSHIAAVNDHNQSYGVTLEIAGKSTRIEMRDMKQVIKQDPTLLQVGLSPQELFGRVQAYERERRLKEPKPVAPSVEDYHIAKMKGLWKRFGVPPLGFNPN